jgi:hypothetical protein
MTWLALRTGCGVVTIIVRGEPAFGYSAPADSMPEKLPESANTMKAPSYDEAIYMTTIKRERAKLAISKIIESYGGGIGYIPRPGLDVLLDYFGNMVYAIELLMKVLADDWRVSTKSEFNHGVGKMYKEIFNRDYTKSDLMRLLREAIVDQKFIYEPSGALAARVPEIEELWDELKCEYYRRHFGRIMELRKTVTMPKDFSRYLLANVERFYTQQPVELDQKTKAEKIQMAECRIRLLQAQLETLRASPDDEPADFPKQCEQFKKAHQEKLDGFRWSMALKFGAGTELTFGTWTGRAVVNDFLG